MTRNDFWFIFVVFVAFNPVDTLCSADFAVLYTMHQMPVPRVAWLHCVVARDQWRNYKGLFDIIFCLCFF